MHAIYEVYISDGSKVIAKVKVDNRQTNRQTNKQTGQKQYAPDHSIRGHKKSTTFNTIITFVTMHASKLCRKLVQVILIHILRIDQNTFQKGKLQQKCDHFSPSRFLHGPDIKQTTVYSFEFAQSYFRPSWIWNWFTQSWICPFSILIHYPLYIIQLAQFWIRPQVRGRKGRK